MLEFGCLKNARRNSAGVVAKTVSANQDTGLSKFPTYVLAAPGSPLLNNYG